MRPGWFGLMAVLSLVPAFPAVAGAAVFRFETCQGEVEADLGDRELIRIYPGPRLGARLASEISPARALELGKDALRRSAILGRRFWNSKISFVALLRPRPPDRLEKFYSIEYIGYRCEKAKSRGNTILALVSMKSGGVILPVPVEAHRVTPPRPQAQRAEALRLLASAAGSLYSEGERLAFRVERSYKNLRCSWIGCPEYDLDLSSLSYTDGPPDVRLIAEYLPTGSLWFPSQNEWPQLSPREAAGRAVEAIEEYQDCEPGTLVGSLVPELRLVRPGGWLYVVNYVSGPRCRERHPPAWDHLQGELVVLMNGDVLVPDEGAITFLPRARTDDSKGHYRFHQLRSSRRYRPPEWP